MRSCEIDAGVERLVSQTPFKPDQTRSSTSHERQPRRRCQECRYHLIYLFDCRRRSFHYRMSCLAVVAAGLQCLGTFRSRFDPSNCYTMQSCPIAQIPRSTYRMKPPAEASSLAFSIAPTARQHLELPAL